jgi:4-azaleucine resistance transporter AzlC
LIPPADRRSIVAQASAVSAAVVPFGIAFGVLADQTGLTSWEASAFSLLVFTGSAQFAAIDLLRQGGTAFAAVVAGLLLNLRSLAFGVTMASTLDGPAWKRALWSQLMIDESTAIALAQTDRVRRRFAFVCTGLFVFVAWNVSTVVGATAFSSAGSAITDWGLDAVGPAVFLALLWPRLRHADQRRTAISGAAIALVVAPFVPAGLPILAAGIGVVAGWRSPASEAPR